MKWLDERDNGEVLINLVCIIYFDDFMPIMGIQIQYLPIELKFVVSMKFAVDEGKSKIVHCSLYHVF